MAVGPSMYDPEGTSEKILKGAGIWDEHIWVGDVFGTKLARVDGVAVQVEAKDRARGIWFGSIMSRMFEVGLADGSFRGHPYEIMQGGLDEVEAVSKKLREGNREDTKFVTRIADTQGMDR